MSIDIIKLLRKTPIFSTLDSSSLKKLFSFFKERTYPSGEILFKEGTLGDTLYIIKEGAIKIGKEAKEGEEEISQALRREGDIFGESGFLDESPRPVTAQAIKETLVLQLSRSDFLTILNDYPLIAYQIVKVLSIRLKQSDLRIIEELKEKNEQLQKAYHALQEMAKTSDSKRWSEEPSISKGEKENFSDRLLTFIPYSVVFTDESDVILYFSKTAEKEFCYKSEEVTGKPIKMLWSEASWLSLFPAIQKKLAEKDFWQGEIIAKRKNGEHFLSWTTVSVIFDNPGKSSGKLYISQNVTQKRFEEKEERIREEAFLQNQIVAEIGNVIGREIKTLSDAYEAHPFELDEINLNKSMKTLTKMRDALKNLKGLISDMPSSNLAPSNKEPLDLASLFEEELLLLKSQDRFREITFTTHFEEGMPKVEGDKRQLQQLLYTILDNASFALQAISDRKKAITIEIGGINKSREVQIQILDNGIGISPANLSKVFKERFTTKKSGMGLGLLSVARIVKNHDGRIEVESDEGTYTLFVITLPTYQEKSASLHQVEEVSKAHS
jgi:PAS domain S-box-containing protein